jgi:hypothetical protein
MAGQLVAPVLEGRVGRVHAGSSVPRIARLDPAVAIARAAVVVGVVVAAIVLWDAVVVMVVSRRRGWECNGAADPHQGESNCDSCLGSSEHLCLLSLVVFM